MSQEDVHLNGHAIEFRITAEDPAYDFRPQTGVVEDYLPPSGPGGKAPDDSIEGRADPPAARPEAFRSPHPTSSPSALAA